ncbi:glycoside hydrolase family 18 protein [Kitasatospora sp. NPDC049285]|uniref:glycoside hydrolase family 18 protein n=1 Tax=Kitasatospora sp. NPDC049285 TaxID=3157096 RepID=UPI0034136E65
MTEPGGRRRELRPSRAPSWSEWRTLPGRARRRWAGRVRWSWRRRAVTALGLALVLAVLPLLGAAVALRWGYAGEPPADARTRGRDALWLGHAWVDGRRSPADLGSLVARLAGTGIHDLYVHTGPLGHDGSLDPALAPGAADFVRRAHAALPGVRVQSWLGDVVAPEKDGLHLDDPAVRGRVADSARQVLDLGFDGVHLDLEPVHSGSPGFLALLDEVRGVTAARGAPLSVAAPQIDPWPGVGRVSLALTGHGKWWSRGYFAEAARRVDQIAVMSYDTSMPVESLYGGYVARQTSLALAATPPGTDLLMGLPAYWADSSTHHGDAETVRAAVRGARLALGPDARQNFGLALYVDFAATPDHWAAYRDGWCI